MLDRNPTRFADTMTTLTGLDAQMVAKGFSNKRLSTVVPIEHTRIGDLASSDIRRVTEPWLWEAHALARALGCDDIATLINEPLAALAPTEDPYGDLNIWRTGCPLPLSHAIRLTRLFGLADPYDLMELIRLRTRDPIVREAWTIAATGERTPTLLDRCPWCAADTPHHLDTCVPNNLWGPRDLDVVQIGGKGPEPRHPGSRQIGRSFHAPGLKRLRTSLGVTQQNMADNLGCSLAHYCKLENKSAKLTADNAQVLMRKFQVSMLDLSTEPVPVKVERELAPPPSGAPLPPVEAV